MPNNDLAPAPDAPLSEQLGEQLSDQFSGQPNDQLTGHVYDGIEEYDNPLPGWWKWSFIATIVYSILYGLYLHGGAEGRSVEEGYAAAMADNMRLQFQQIGDLQVDEATVFAYLSDPQWLKVGESVFRSHCVSCHGSTGAGLVGPNLTDDYYKHIKTVGDILAVVQNGAAGGAMPAWKTRLHPNEIVLVSSYVGSLRGAAGANPKPPEGQEIPPWTAPEKEPAAPQEDGLASATPGETHERYRP